MTKLRFVLGLLVLTSIIYSAGSISTRFDPNYTRRRRIVSTIKKNVVPIHKVLVTQRGYIQFLRWKLPVPKIEEFTFCLWVKSVNLTYTHSIFSYSKNERERLIRSWISPFGRSVHMEIGNKEIFAHPTFIEEHRWYHMCQSWENVNGRYALWIDGHVKTSGYAKQTLGHVIPPDGDIVVGQEYTDFDKGLEDGIEGAIFGFNLLLISAFGPPDTNFQRIQEFAEISKFPVEIASFPRISGLIQIGPEFEIGSRTGPPVRLRKSVRTMDVGSRTNYDFKKIISSDEQKILNSNETRRTIRASQGNLEVNSGIFSSQNRRTERKIVFNENHDSINGIVDYKLNGSGTIVFLEDRSKMVENERNRFEENLQKKKKAGEQVIPLESRSKGESTLLVREGENRRKRRNEEKPVGLQLIELTYGHCKIGRGSPFIGGSRMLISWTRTPVKVYGGAILKNARSDCGHF